MVPPLRLERKTHSLEGCCSIQLSYEGKKQYTGRSLTFDVVYWPRSKSIYSIPLCFVARRGVEPLFSEWKSDELTDIRTRHDIFMFLKYLQ